MSKQRSTQSTSGRSSQSGSSRSTAATGATTTPQDQTQSGGLGGRQDAGVGDQYQSRNKAQDLAGQVQQKATQQVESGFVRGKTQAAQTLNTVAESLLVSGQQLRERNQERVSRFVDQAADRVQRVSNYLNTTDVSEIIDRTEEFARRRPALFLGGAFALGLLGARFLKSSRRQQDQFAGRGYAGGATRSGQGYSRGRSVNVEQEVPTPGGQEWAASGTAASGFADVARTDPQVGLESEPGFEQQRRPRDYGLPPSGPEASV